VTGNGTLWVFNRDNRTIGVKKLISVELTAATSNSIGNWQHGKTDEKDRNPERVTTPGFSR